MRVLEGFAGPGGLSEAAAMLGIGDVLGIETNIDACTTALAVGAWRICTATARVGTTNLIG